MSSWTDRVAHVDLSTCDTGTDVVLGVIGVIALAVCFAGYRLYKTALVLLAFLFAAAIEGAIGSVWIERSPENQVAKKLIVAVFCILWGLMGAWVCRLLADRLNHLLGFILGAAVGAALVGAIVQIIKSITEDRVDDSGYLGWDQFAVFTVGIPVAILVGYKSKNSVKYFLMLASAILGAYIAVRSFTAIMVCAKVDPEVMARPAVKIIAVVVIAVLGAITQLYTQPPEERKTVIATVDGVASQV
mmetsp:Transcript_11556/g.20469  ORF Transcript_11556/g.20469 Transcript_11556/m.20469 type:complete len:245 (+) Transcript_11556:63-797(+)